MYLHTVLRTYLPYGPVYDINHHDQSTSLYIPIHICTYLCMNSDNNNMENHNHIKNHNINNNPRTQTHDKLDLRDMNGNHDTKMKIRIASWKLKLNRFRTF